MPVPGKLCARYITRSVKRKDRKDKRLLEFLRAYAKPSRAQRKQYEFLTGRKAPKPLTEKEREAWVKKTFALIKGRGLGELEMFTISDLCDEYWNGEWKIDKEKKQLVRGKGEKHQRARKGWRKAQATIKEKARLREQREKERQREATRLERERIRRAWENLEKPRAAVTKRPYI